MSSTNLENAEDMEARAWDQYWAGREQTDALICEGVEKNSALIAFWNEVFAQGPAGGVLDIACGSGSVLRLAAKAGKTPLTGLDIAQGAIAGLQDRVPGANGVLGSASALPFQDQSSAHVVSQYGLEYAGVMPAIAEAARIVAPGGALTLLCHYQDGAIEQDVMQRAGAAQIIVDENFFAKAQEFFSVVFDDMAGKTGARERFGVIAPEFQAVTLQLQQVAQQPNQPLAAHLFDGTKQLFDRRHAYALEDVLGWLSGMEGEVAAFLDRMTSMRKAAVSAGEAKEIVALLHDAGLQAETPDEFYFAEGEAPAAWIFKARRG